MAAPCPRTALFELAYRIVTDKAVEFAPKECKLVYRDDATDFEPPQLSPPSNGMLWVRLHIGDKLEIESVDSLWNISYYDEDIRRPCEDILREHGFVVIN